MAPVKEPDPQSAGGGFDEKDPPGGAVILTFSGGAALRLEVECLEVELADLGPTWATECCPDHTRARSGRDRRAKQA